MRSLHISHSGRSTMKRQSTLVAFSGGQDSTTCLF
ncbi:NADPH-dependent 7-cyano-7-deazaguanine reductase QueF, partial [Streptococcus pneumoniae]